ncbi:MAG: hypothetical protein K0Q59_4751 [Paenibacillus sp.]|nr:hypothetical protein [Paenibacillus sp.]
MVVTNRLMLIDHPEAIGSALRIVSTLLAPIAHLRAVKSANKRCTIRKRYKGPFFANSVYGIRTEAEADKNGRLKSNGANSCRHDWL